MPVEECDPAAARDRLEAAGIAIEPGNTEHEHWRASHGDATAVAYDGKVVVQGATPHDLLGYLRDSSGEATLFVDGASRGNPGPAAIGWVLRADGSIVAETGRTIGRATNNQAEYAALIDGLEAATRHGFDQISVRTDSELVVKQIRGEYATRNPTLQERRVTVHELLAEFDEWELQHVPRELNERADALANDALDE